MSAGVLVVAVPQCRRCDRTGPPPGLRLLRAARLAAVLTALCIPPSDALAAELLACQAKDAVNLQNDGTLKTDSLAQRAAQGSLVIDLSNGEVRSAGERESLKMTARRHGNETVLVPSFAPEFVRNVIRIHQTAGQIVFSQYILDLFISGTCAPIQ
jgi:hypothetical protein